MPSEYSIVVKPLAVEDILGIASYIAEQSLDWNVASLWVESVYEHIAQLERFPNSYSSLGILPYRKVVHGNYLIVYRVDEAEMRVFVCRVVHGARLIGNLGPLED